MITGCRDSKLHMDFLPAFQAGRGHGCKSSCTSGGVTVVGERGDGRRGDLGTEGRRDIFCSDKKARREGVGACTSVRSQRREMLQVPDGVGMDLGGCWCRCLDHSRWEGGKLEPLSP